MKFVLSLCALAALAQGPGFVKVPAGSFVMGCQPGYACEATFPRREVRFDQPFWISKTEITVRQFQAFVKATGYRTDAEKAGDRRTWKAPGWPSRNSQPVVFMTLRDAEAYCASIGARVPYEAEWEYAGHAGTTTYHYWGEEFDGRYAWYFENSGGRPGPVGGKLPNAWGLYDMEGNAFEWVTAGPYHNSIGKSDRGNVRGGSWNTCPEPYPPRNGIRSRGIGLTVPFETFKDQTGFPPDYRRFDTGFRCAAR